MRSLVSHAARWALVAWLSTMACAQAADAPRAWLDRDSMHLGETVTLNVESSDASASAPDFSALSSDFDVGGTQSSQQTSIVNGVRSEKMLWAIVLQPKHEGHITIAPLKVGNAQTAPVQLDVLAAAPPSQAGADVFFQIDAQPHNPYVQQQVRYTVKLYYAVDLTGGNIGQPKADGLSVKHLGQDKQYLTTIGTRRYQVVEQHYALTAEHSGTLTIPALMFRGTALDARDPTAFFSSGRQVTARSEPVVLDVRAQPAAWPAGQAWLPAASLLLQEQSPLPDEARVGDPVTRTIRLQAQGVGYEQLPQLQMSAPDGADVYPDKAETRTRDDGDWLYGEQVRKFAIVPSKPGNLTLPAMSVTWWNTQADRLETTSLPAHVIRVLPAVGATATASPPAASAPVVQGTPAAAAPGIAPPTAVGSPYMPLLTDSQVQFWRLMAGVLFLLWLVTLVAWLQARRRSPAKMEDRAAPSNDPAAHRAAFMRACALGEFAAAERALVAWSRSEQADVRNLGELMRRLANAGQREALLRLQKVRYAGAPGDGLAAVLHDAFKNGLGWASSSPPRAADEPLPALYPGHD